MSQKTIEQLHSELDAQVFLSVDQRLTIAHEAIELSGSLELGRPGYIQERDRAMLVAFKAVSGVAMNFGHTAKSLIQIKGQIEPGQVDHAADLFNGRLVDAIPPSTPGVSRFQGSTIYSQSLFTRLEYLYLQFQKSAVFKLMRKKTKGESLQIRYTEQEPADNVVSLANWKQKGQSHDNE